MILWIVFVSLVFCSFICLLFVSRCLDLYQMQFSLHYYFDHVVLLKNFINRSENDWPVVGGVNSLSSMVARHLSFEIVFFCILSFCLLYGSFICLWMHRSENSLTNLLIEWVCSIRNALVLFTSTFLYYVGGLRWNLVVIVFQFIDLLWIYLV